MKHQVKTLLGQFEGGRGADSTGRSGDDDPRLALPDSFLIWMRSWQGEDWG